MSSMHQYMDAARDREIRKSTRKLSTGNKFSTNVSADSGAFNFSTRLKAMNRIGEVSRSNLQQTYELAQYQADIIHHIDSIVSRMSDLAYKATDTMVSDSTRNTLDQEFQAYSSSLRNILYTQEFGFPLFDPLASKFIDENDFPEPVAGGAAETKTSFNLGALAAKIKLWYTPYTARDRLQFFQGDDMIFDTGEYSRPGGNPGNPAKADADYFEIDYEPYSTTATVDPGNSGNAEKLPQVYWIDDEDHGDGLSHPSSAHNHDPYQIDFSVNTTVEGVTGEYHVQSETSHPAGYAENAHYSPKTGVSRGDSTILSVVVNRPFSGRHEKTGGTLWDLWWEIQKKPVTGPMGLMGDNGELMELKPLGFSTLEGLSLKDRVSAAGALEQTSKELENLQWQVGTLAKSFSETRLRSDFLELKSHSQSISLGRISDTDIATESTKLAKNLILKEAASHSLIHARLGAERVMNLLL
jgi:flagellin-like hook-associated protein FlgL